MFDIGFSELLVIAVIALLVLGPERLPKAARFAGLWVRRARAQWYSVRSELERELAADELKRSLRETETQVRDIDASVRAADAEARREFDAMRGATRAMPAETVEAVEAVESPAAVTPTDRRGAAAHAHGDASPEPDSASDDATGEARNDRA
ncbi:Sec-independent protein translocase protein TatB [Luteimonas mephitis]|uniref:Sec-independent protein translocase protein TatB n=1 Tax=Luteimonas mephitis TaxID=83615 RepID=UPI0004075B83|nr:Sec-independent protein translocase protein TatB [Luteimonas mephitis]